MRHSFVPCDVRLPIVKPADGWLFGGAVRRRRLFGAPAGDPSGRVLERPRWCLFKGKPKG